MRQITDVRSRKRNLRHTLPRSIFALPGKRGYSGLEAIAFRASRLPGAGGPSHVGTNIVVLRMKYAEKSDIYEPPSWFLGDSGSADSRRCQVKWKVGFPISPAPIVITNE